MTIRVFRILAIIEALLAIPLAYFLPSSMPALILAVGILFGLNASLIATIGRARSAPLHILNATACGIGLGLVLVPSMTIWMLAGCVGALCLLLVILGCLQLPEPMLKVSFAVQMVGLAAILVTWAIIQKYGLVSGEEKLAVDHLQMGLRFLFSAPLSLVAITNFTEQLRVSRYLVPLIAVCMGQWGIGFFELGAALQILPLIVSGFAFEGAFLLLLVFAVIPRRRKRT